jgi:hypothetical protein
VRQRTAWQPVPLFLNILAQKSGQFVCTKKKANMQPFNRKIDPKTALIFSRVLGE